MNTDRILLLFDVIIILLGIYGMYSAIRMKKTGMPPVFLLSEEERSKMADKKSFCEKLFLPTLLFAAVSCLYGITELFNWYVMHQRAARYVGAVCFLLICLWYVKEFQKIKADFI